MADEVSCSAGITACTESVQWQAALELLEAAPLEVIPYNATLTAYERISLWQQGLLLLGLLEIRRIQADSISFTATIASCRAKGQWQAALQLLTEALWRRLDADVARLRWT